MRIYYEKERFYNSTTYKFVNIKVIYLNGRKMEIADLTNESVLNTLKKFCKEKGGRFELFNNNVSFVASNKKPSQSINSVFGDWVDADDNIIERSIKAIEFEGMTHFFSKLKGKNVRILSSYFQIKK
jgi:hypothetical protein